MVNDSWVIRWHDYIADTYSFGSIIKFNKDKSVYFENRLMTPGAVVNKWHSKTNFQAQRAEPTLPLIDGESPYEITLKADWDQSNKDGLMLRVIFYGRYDEIAKSIILRDRKNIIKPPITTYSYSIELIKGGADAFTFDSILIREASKEEYDEEQKRIEQAKQKLEGYKKRVRKNQKRK